MKKLTMRLSAVLLLTAVILFSSCSKEGSAGATGPAGPAGPAGPTGANGAQGEDGTANVIYSEWMDVTFNPATDTVNNVVDTLAWVAEIPAAKLDNTILTTGEIKVYFNAGTAADPAVFPLPLFDYYSLTGVFNINLYFTDGTINLYATDDASTYTDGTDKLWQFRYILIPGGTSARKSTNINWNDYAQVKKYLNLKD